MDFLVFFVLVFKERPLMVVAATRLLAPKSNAIFYTIDGVEVQLKRKPQYTGIAERQQFIITNGRIIGAELFTDLRSYLNHLK